MQWAKEATTFDMGTVTRRVGVAALVLAVVLAVWLSWGHEADMRHVAEIFTPTMAGQFKHKGLLSID